MSSGEIVRKPLRRSERSSRALDQRLFLRFPRLLVAYLRLLDSLPPRSRLRQAAIWRAVRLALGGWNRRDLDALQIGFRPDYEFFPAHEVVEAGLSERCYRGPAGFRKFWSSFYEAWGGDIRIEPVELIDLGDRLALLVDMPGSGRASGLRLTQKYAWVVTLKDGVVIRVQEFLDHAEALEAVGLKE